tara:strand:- start:180 stop:656 length:477 start_codon:yes stop_codon:yes gene_type:complete
MRKIVSYTLLVNLLLIFTACGYTIVDRSKLINFKIVEINTTGEKRINYKLKNKLLINSKDNSEKLIILDLNTNKKKTIKEKNIKNEITKYQINISIDVRLKRIDSGIVEKFSVQKDGDISVASQYSQTLSNEKKLTDLLIEKLADKIFEELNVRVDDL